jgi:hypothetical protein
VVLPVAYFQMFLKIDYIKNKFHNIFFLIVIGYYKNYNFGLFIYFLSLSLLSFFTNHVCVVIIYVVTKWHIFDKAVIVCVGVEHRMRKTVNIVGRWKTLISFVQNVTDNALH